MISKKRMKDLMIELIKIDSETGNEKQVGEHLIKLFKSMELKVETDNCGKKFGSNFGNIYAKFKGIAPEKPSLILSAHMDTVSPGKNIKPIVEGDIVKTDGSTILGSDDKAGISIIVEVIKNIMEEKLHTGNIDIIISVCEETGMLGAKNFDISKLESKFGFALDSTEPDELTYGAPAANTMDFRVHGISAHAGMAPEKGINAIQILSEGIAKMNIGRIDYETTANIGLIKGGSARNSVPDFAEAKGEARSHDEKKLEKQTKHMIECIESAVKEKIYDIEGEKKKPKADIKVKNDYKSYRLDKENKIINLVLQAGKEIDMDIKLVLGGGGTDANIYNQKGIDMAVLGIGMRNVHTLDEYIDTNDMVKSTKLISKILEINK